MAVVNYSAWKAGYMPPTEHVIIHELEHGLLRVVFRSSIGDGGSINVLAPVGVLDCEAVEALQWFAERKILESKRRAKGDKNRKAVWADIDQGLTP